MGVIQSKKEGLVKKYELKVDLKAEIKSELLDLSNWSLPDIKQAYDIYARTNDCPFIDFFAFHKMMPFTTEVSRYVFDSYGLGDTYINIFELICILILMSHNNYRKKLQMLFVIFDFSHLDRLTNRQIILIFQSTVNGFCRITGQHKPKYEYLTKYTIERFIRVNTLEALEKVVTYRRLIEQIQGNNDAFELFKRFDQEIYGYFTQESYLFRVNQYKKYAREDMEKIYRIIKKVNLDKNYEEVELVEKNRRFRLENRKVECIRHLLEEKEQKFKQTMWSKIRSNSMAMSSSALPTIRKQQSLLKFSPKIIAINTLSKLNPQSKSQNKRKVLLLNGKLECKQDVFETIKYFKSLSGNKAQIKAKQFFQSFDKKPFLKKQTSSLFKHFDLKKKGEVNFDTFLRAYYRNITQGQIDIINQWYCEYKMLHEADQFDVNDVGKKKEKKARIELPRTTVNRIDQIFNSIDKERKGFLVMEDLKRSYNSGFTIKQLQDIMKQFGKNNKIYKEEFIKMTLPEDWSIEGTQYVGV